MTALSQTLKAALAARLLYITGELNRPPTKAGITLTDTSTGVYTYSAILAALKARQRIGKGQKIDSVATVLLERSKEVARFGTEHPSVVPYGAFKTKESWLVCRAANNRQFRVLVEPLGCPEIAEDERFGSTDERVENRDEWLTGLEGSGMPYGSINSIENSIENSFKHPQIEVRFMVDFVDFEATADEILKIVSALVNFGDVMAGVRCRPPLLGEHIEEILTEADIFK
ncbi:CoA-transferase family III [Stipitochalara longipes BDJ]|nr:CoA-transferase family III [Stipitochalara longipes BDJ]